MNSFFEHFSMSDIKWRIEGPFDSSYSLALLTREIAMALKKRGVDVALHSTEGPGDFEPSKDFLDKNKDIAVLHDRSFTLNQEISSVTSRNLYPPRVEDMVSNCNLLHSYAWEETSFPFDWANKFNQHLDGLTCLSRHVMKVMQDNGISVPMAVSGCGVDHWERIIPSSSSLLDKISAKSFRFLHVSSFFPRKGPKELLEAYGKAFNNNDDVCLVIKTFPNPHNNVHQQLAELRSKYPEYPQVVLIEDDLSDSDLKALYQRCQVLVAPSCAEGFGLPLAEAMLTGIPVITTGWSGQLDFCNDKNSWLVDYQFKQAETHFKLLPSAWAVADVDSLSSAMIAAYGSTAEHRNHMAQAGRAMLLSDFTWEKVAQRLIAFYKKLSSIDTYGDAKIGWVTTWNTKCGIATYSEHVISEFKVHPTIFAANTNEIVSTDSEHCIRCWDIGDLDGLVALSNAIESEGIDVVVVQFNFGFFHHDHLIQFLRKQKDAGRVIVLDMHATIDPPQAPQKKLSNFIPGLQLADRLLVHSIADMNRLKSLGLIDNLVLFPHGILDVDFNEIPQPDTPTIATYGFCLPHKGLEDVLEAVGLLKNSGISINLKMINAEYPIDFSTELVSNLRKRICQLGLKEQVELETKFLSDDESLSLLQSADLVVFAYHPTSESASGAVRYGFASGKPTMVTDIPIFDEFGDSVWRVPHNNPVTLADSIKRTLSEIREQKPTFIERQKAAENWRSYHQYSRLSARLQGLLQALFLQNQYF